MDTFVELDCSFCSKQFKRKKAEVSRQQRNGREIFFCSLSCHRSNQNKINPGKGNAKNLRAGNRLDRLSPFRWYMARARYRDKEQTLSEEFLAKLWTKQKGKCPLTGWNLILPKTTMGFVKTSPRNASLDRIDNRKGYIRGNVRFVCLMANLARYTFSDADVVKFAIAVSNN